MIQYAEFVPVAVAMLQVILVIPSGTYLLVISIPSGTYLLVIPIPSGHPYP